MCSLEINIKKPCLEFSMCVFYFFEVRKFKSQVELNAICTVELCW